MAALLQLISLFTRWHMAGGLLFQMDTTLFSTRLSGGGVALLCYKVLSGWPQCKDLQEGMWLQDAQSQTCAPVIVALSRAPCDGYKSAYILGILSLMAFIFNWLLMGVSGLLLQQYMTGKHKPEYRNMSLYMLLGGLLLLLFTLLLYSVIALPSLDKLGAIVNVTSFGSTPAGASHGYFILWFSVIFQTVALILHRWMPLKNEMTEEERLRFQMQKEQGRGQTELQAYPHGNYPPQPGAPYGGPPGYGGPGAPNAPGYPGYGGPGVPPYGGPAPGYGGPAAGYGAPGTPGYGAPPPGAGGRPGMPPQWGQQA